VAAGDRDPDIPDLGGDEFGDLARQLKNMARDLGDRETALAAEYEETRQLLLTVLPPRLVKNGSELNPESDVADVATVIAVGVDLTRGGVEVDESEIASLMDRVRDVAEETAERAGVERVRAGADRYLFLSGLSDTDDGADRALGFASDLSQRLAALALLEDAPMTSRIGVSTGPVATGVLQKGSLTFGAWGEPVRRALAISAISPADQVLVDDSSRASLTDQKWPLDPADDVGGLDGGAMVLFSLSVPPAEDATPGEDTK
jgi:class 3 adenylate cyclase